MNEQSRDGWSLEHLRALIEDIRTTKVKPGPHLTAEQVDAFAEDRLDEATTAYATAHIDWCEECAIEVIARDDERAEEDVAEAACVGAGAVVPLPTRVAPQAPLVFESHHARRPPPGCVAPLERAAREQWSDIAFREPKNRGFAIALPPARLRDGVCPLFVTTAFRAAYEHRCGGAWRTVIPLALAPRVTRIVTTKKSKLANLDHYDLMTKLDGRCIAVGDPTSTFAARLIAAAHHYGTKTELVKERPKRRKRKTLYLITKDFNAMAAALEQGEIDGFASVEPFPTLAEDHLNGHYGAGHYAEAVLGPHCTSTSTGFCCVVMAPRELLEEPQYADAYRSLVQTLFRSLWRVLKDARLEIGTQDLGKDAQLAGAQGVSKRAAAAMLRHFVDDLDLLNKTRPALIDTLVERFVPEVTPESLNADYEALSGFLSDGKLLKMKRAGPPVALYDTGDLRTQCREALEEEFGETSLPEAVRDVQRAYEDSAVAT